MPVRVTVPDWMVRPAREALAVNANVPAPDLVNVAALPVMLPSVRMLVAEETVTVRFEFRVMGAEMVWVPAVSVMEAALAPLSSVRVVPAPGAMV